MQTVEINWAEIVVRFLTNPIVSPLLLSLGVFYFVEFHEIPVNDRLDRIINC